MYHVIYMSSAVSLFSADDLWRLLQQSRRWNEAHGITGALFYRDGNFLQVIEGEKEGVASLFASIRADSRHHAINPLFQEDIAERDFAQWSMAFHDLKIPGTVDATCFDDLLNLHDPGLAIANLAPKVQAFLKAFVR